jgi:uncharacterized membrane protein
VTPRPDRHPEDGSILPLVAGFLAIALAVILVVAAASSLYLERKRLFTLADAAALEAAESFPIDAVEVGADGRVRARLTDGLVRDAARDYLTAVSGGPEGLVLEEATVEGGTTASVTLSALWRPPVAGPLLPEVIRIEVTSTARTAFR